MHDVEHSGRPSIIMHDIVKLVRERSMENRQFTIMELSSHFPLLAEMSATQWFQSQTADFHDTGIKKSWSHGVTKVSFPEVNMLKNSSTLAVSIPINLSIALGFISVNGPRESYFVEALCTIKQYKYQQ